MIAYTVWDYLSAAVLAFGILVFMLAILLDAGRRLQQLGRRIMGETPASAQEAAQRVTEAEFAATRNTRQDIYARRK